MKKNHWNKQTQENHDKVQLSLLTMTLVQPMWSSSVMPSSAKIIRLSTSALICSANTATPMMFKWPIMRIPWSLSMVHTMLEKMFLIFSCVPKHWPKYVYMYVYMYGCVWLCMHGGMHACMYVWMDPWIDGCLRIYIYIYWCMFLMYVCMYCMYVCMHACMYVCMVLYACIVCTDMTWPEQQNWQTMVSHDTWWSMWMMYILKFPQNTCMYIWSTCGKVSWRPALCCTLYRPPSPPHPGCQYTSSSS